MPKTTADAISSRIVNLIESGHYSGSAHLSTNELASHFGVSRTPIRQALESLASQDVIERRPNRGYFVLPRPAARENLDLAMPEDVGSEYYRIAEDWLSDHIPGDTTEQFVRQRYGLSRAQASAVLARAAEEGWAERKPGYGWRLLPVIKTAESLEHVYRLRAILEPAALMEPSFEPDKNVLARLRQTHEKLLAGDMEHVSANLLLAAGMDFHESLVDLARNPILTFALKRVNRLRRLMEYKAMIDRKRLYTQFQDHIIILDAIEEGDNIKAAYLMKRHLSGAIASKSPVLVRFSGSDATN